MGIDTLDIIAPALVAGLMITLANAPLGIEVLRRGIIFIDLAVAQIAGVGLVAANLWLHEPAGWMLQAIALTCAVGAGLFFRHIEARLPERQEALIGCSFVLAASLAILFLADHPQSGDEIQHLLSGQILFVNWADIARHAPIYIAIMAVWFLLPNLRRRGGIGFYLIFAAAITSAVQLVGVYVVFAGLILPALAAMRARRPYVTAWLCGSAAILSGGFIALAADLPTGPMIVVAYTACAFIIYHLTPQQELENDR